MRKNLDLRKSLGVTKIYLKSRFVCTILRSDNKKMKTTIEIFATCTYFEMIKRQDKPESLTIESPKNSANLLAVLIEVDF